MTFQYTLIDIDLDAYKKLLDTSLSEDLREGGKEWLTAAISVIPLWSGASHGTFIKMARSLGMSLTVSGGSTFGPGSMGPGAGSAASAAILVGNKGLHTIEYRTALWHLIYNEYKDANQNPIDARLFHRLKQPGPYGFQDIGNVSFLTFSRQVKLPSLKPALKLTKRRV